MLGVTAEVDGAPGLRGLKPGEGIESVDGFCRGLNALDELADISSQLLNRKYPRLGPIRVSCFVNIKVYKSWELFVKYSKQTMNYLGMKGLKSLNK